MAGKANVAKRADAGEARRIALVQEALQVYGIDPKYVFGCGVYEATDEVVVVTKGGKKFRHKSGDPAKFTLSEVEITGVRPEIKMFRGGPKNQSDEMVWDAKLNGRRPKDKDIPPEFNFVWDEKLGGGRPVDR